MNSTMEPPASVPARTNGNGAVQRFEAFRPVGSPSALKALIESQKGGLAAMLPKHITPERLFKTLLVAANRNQDILKCTQASILETINRAAELGLDLSGTLGEAYPVPFNNKVKTPNGDQWLMQLQLIIGYRGMEKLAWQSGEIESIDAEVVHVNDKFTFRKGTEVEVNFEPFLGDDRGGVVGAYACLKMKGGGKLARFLTRADIEKIRNSSKSKDSPAWRNWWDEMARKCALKRVLKDAPLSTEKMVRVIEHDAEDLNLSDVLSASTGSGANRLRDRVTHRPVSENQTFEVDADAGHAVDAQAAASGETFDAATGEVIGGTQETPEPEADADHRQPETPAEQKVMLSHTEFITAMESRGQQAGMEPTALFAWLAEYAKTKGLTTKQIEKQSPAWRAAAVSAFMAENS